MKLYVACIFSLLILFAGCSKPKPEEYVGKANVAINQKNFQLAIEEFEKLIKDHPDSPQAEEALFTIASLRNDEMHDFSGAIVVYKRYTEKYPKGSRAPLALFLTGYLYNNELHDSTNAKVAYKEFLTRFPDHEMAKSADFELSHLGKKPEDLLPTIQQSAPQTATKTPNTKPAKKK